MAEALRLELETEQGERLTLRGREAWAMHQLIRAGENGVTPIERPAPRWSHYIMQLRRRGLEIETVRLQHGGAFAGHHGRYVLRTPVKVVSVVYRGGQFNAA